ncbi:helix-turn-helix domain-containing protein [Massilia sp. GCM10020059]|uniref:Helix-turn-helix transcriptional regulator n=1 Tax=Massilia agrisoli TaxID=2892444 RepID=A0ABS8IUD7_9BURK|nr:helix-turn-helix transcriptional regulator [Massilia agrisoli]MCC6071566.1 helix-turn-helix transcriptional regulator [Massilia agrisoli]
MPQAITLVDTLKRLLKSRGITYGELAARIGMSEASVKRMFSQKNFTLQRLDQILDAAGIGFDELNAAQGGPKLVAQLTLAQEKEIIGDPQLLVVAVSAMNHIGFDDIVRTYTLSEAQVTACLLRLDKIGFLELLPNNRVKLLIARTFSWIANGPIQSYFRSEAAADYLNARFDGAGEVLGLVNVMLSKQSSAALIERLKQVAADIAQQHQIDARVPLDQKQAMSFMLAARPWVPHAFQALLRQPSPSEQSS